VHGRTDNGPKDGVQPVKLWIPATNMRE